MNQQNGQKKSALSILRKLFVFLWLPEWTMRLRILAALFFLVATIYLNIRIPLIFKTIVNMLSACSAISVVSVKFLFLLYGAVYALSKVTHQMREIIIARVLSRAVGGFNIAIFDHLHALSLRFHIERKTGAVATIIARVQRAFPDIFMELFIFLVPTVIEVIIVMLLLWYFYSFFYAFLLFAILTVYLICSMIGVEWLAKAQKVNNQKEERVSTRIVDSLLNFETVKYFNNQHFEHEQCVQAISELEDASTTKHVRGETVQLIQGVIMAMGLMLLTWISGNEVLKGTMKVDDFVLINTYLIQFFTPLSFFGVILRHIRRGFADMQSALDLLEIKPDIIDVPGALQLVADRVEVEFDRVQFGYNSARQILKGVSFKIPAGKTVAIVGLTGSGKSTIARLLFRLYDVTGGSIKVNGHDIRTLKQESLQQLLGIVPQDTVLFNNTLYYNIAYGKPGSPKQVVEKAIELAHLNKLVSHLPQGVSTMVGERGLKLSGGEKQRVSIARVLVKNPKMYIFDEATSALDTKTERDIQKNIEEIAVGSTALIIAHRLSTVVNADQIVVLENGLVAEQGTHEQLISQQGLYKRLWEQQLHEE